MATGSGLSGCSCDREKDAPKPDPCASVKPASARFTVHPTIIALYDTVWDYSFGCDTGYGNAALFVAMDSGQTYRWQLGTETITSRTFSRNQFPFNTRIPISLRTSRKNVPEGCLLPDELADSSEHTLYFLPPHRNRVLDHMHGRYRGYRNGNPADTATLTFLMDTLHPHLTQGYNGSQTYGNFWPGLYYCEFSPRRQTQYRQVAFGRTRLEAKQPANHLSEGLLIINDTVAAGLYGRGTISYDGTGNFRYWAVRAIAGAPRDWNRPLKKREARFYTFTGKKIEGY